MSKTILCIYTNKHFTRLLLIIDHIKFTKIFITNDILMN